MCGRYALTVAERLAEKFKARPIEMSEHGYGPLFNIAPTEPAPVIVQEGEVRIIKPMFFGLIPSWAKDAKIAAACVNGRAETIAEKPAFRDALKKRRCLVPADGFYEWVKEGKLSLPYYLTRKDGALFAFAGLWERWKGPSGKEIETFALITTEPNDLMKPLHERMPVILKKEDESLWLAPYVTESKTLLPLLKPYPAEEMTMRRVSTLVNSAKNKGKEVLDEVTEARGNPSWS